MFIVEVLHILFEIYCEFSKKYSIESLNLTNNSTISLSYFLISSASSGKKVCYGGCGCAGWTQEYDLYVLPN